MNRQEAFEYIKIAAEERIRARCKFIMMDENFIDIEHVKIDIEYFQSVMKYIEDNLK